jgi:hypothetical protein
MTMTLKNVPSILEDFSISSTKNLVHNYDNSTSVDTDSAQFQFLRAITMNMHFVTKIDFLELREAARQGSRNIENYDYYIGISIAGVALILGYLALKAEQYSEHYNDILLRNKHYRQLQPQLKEREDTILTLREQIQTLQLESSTRLTIQPSVGASPHSLFFTPSDHDVQPSLPNSVFINVDSDMGDRKYSS